MENQQKKFDYDTKAMIDMVNKNAVDAAKKRELAKQRSLRIQKARIKARKKQVLKIKMSACFLSAVLIVSGTKKVVAQVSDKIEEFQTINEISATYGSGFVDGVMNRTADNEGYWLNYDLMTQAVIDSEDPVYSFYNTVNSILALNLSDSEKLNCLNEFSNAIYTETGGAILIGNDMALYTASTWTEFLEKNNFSAEADNDIDARKIFQEYIESEYIESVNLLESEATR